ncbi:MAG: ParB/RepB/Spo0J family partition protein [Bacteroidales bacterium]|nr:ParB/RepB/Spo0J family partition protein [Bacteroidales bacterium]MBR5650830.1 ParB/RepB/Spo0J family partition protein [Bacteroidales bacterium]MBR5720742.1 ParB/RepB/Spo0J family partition protein [Bacteroidales bacterium]
MSKQKKALGRGLDSILERESYEGNDYLATNNISDIPIAQIDTNPYQPRNEFEETALQELAASIKEHGLIQPVTVRKTDTGKYQLISGGRRLKASQMLNLETIPAYIRSANDEEMLEMALVENIHRRNLNPMEIAFSYQRLIDECSLTQEEVSKKVSMDRSTISNFLRLLKLPEIVQCALKEGKISMGHAKCLLSTDDETKMVDLLRTILEKNLSVRETEHLVSNNKSKTTKKSTKTPQVLPVRMANFRQNFEERTGLSPKIQLGKNGKGVITIPFNSKNNLDEFFKMFE